MNQEKIEELGFLASFIRTTAQANIACSDQKSSEFYVMLRTASQEISRIAKELSADKSLTTAKTLNERLPEHDELMARYQAWYDEKISPHLQ